MATAAATDPSYHSMDIETSDNPNSVAESGSNNNNTSATDTMDTRNATGTLDEDTSSIEALNWCEFDEEEMASAKHPDVIKKEGETMDSEGQETSGSSGGPPLSTSLLRSIDSQMPEDDKITKIENWASDVISATEDDLLGELETCAEGGEISVSTSSTTVYQQVPESEGGIESVDKGTRKRTSKSNLMAMSTISSLSNTDSKGDPLSNAPVLDEGPIWGKGSKRYKFQENRRFNQKLTFGVLLSVVLAIGLGLGNLVAYNECEAEYKATTVPSVAETPADDNLHSTNVPTTPPSTIPQETAQEIVKESIESPEILKDKNRADNDIDVPKETAPSNSPSEPDPAEIKNPELSDDEKDSKTPSPKILNTKPFVDPSYANHAEALASVVKSLDQLSRKIDQFQNTTRQLGGIVMLKEEVIKELRSKSNAKDANAKKENDAPDKPLEEQVHPDLSDEELALEELEESDDMMVAEELIDAIEENEAYEEKQQQKEQLEEIRKLRDEEDRQSGRVQDETYATMENLIKKYMEEIDELDKKFIEQERQRVLEKRIQPEEGNFDKSAAVRNFDEYTEEEKKAVLTRYKQFKKNYEAQHGEGVASVTKKILEHQLLPETVTSKDNQEIPEELLSEEENYREGYPKKDIQDDDELLLENDNEEDFENYDGKIPVQGNNIDEVGNIFEETNEINNDVNPENSYLNIQEYEEYKESAEKVKQDKLIPEKAQKHKEKVRDKENNPHKNKYQKNSFKLSSEEENFKKFEKMKREVINERDNKKWKDMSSEEKRRKYANDNGNQYNKGKSKNQGKKQKFSYKNEQSLEEEREYEEKRKWKKSDQDWVADRAKLRERNRKNSFDDSNMYLAKKNKNWQLDRDRAREKFRNKNKSDDD